MESFIEAVSANWQVWATAAVAVAVSLVAIAKVVTKLTPNTKDDEVVEQIEGYVEKVTGILESVKDKNEPES